MRNRFVLTIVILIVIIIVLAAGFVVLKSNQIETSTISTINCVTTDQEDCIRFPIVTGEDLNGTPVTLPDDFVGQYNLVVVPFDRDQQTRAGDYLEPFQAIAREYDFLDYYSVAALSDLSPAIRLLVTGGLSVAIQDEQTRQRVIVLFLEDQEAFIEAMSIPDTEMIQVFILNEREEVIWNDGGDFEEAKIDEINALMQQLNTN